MADSPGKILNVWPLLGGGPGNGDAFRILYRSTGLKGEKIEVSAAIFIPPGRAPKAGRNVIAWAHPTSGVVRPCAPSLMPDVSGTIWGLPNMLAKNYVVVATDYPGLGTPGTHPYLIGVSEGRAVLDSVRAARALSRSGASNRFAVWGHSQGGHAALYGRARQGLRAGAQARRHGRRGACHLSHGAVPGRPGERRRQGAHRHGALFLVAALQQAGLDHRHAAGDAHL